MDNGLKLHEEKMRFGIKALVAVAFSLLLVGFGIASALQWTGSSVAQGLHKEARLSAPASPSIPGSFAPLAEKLGPTVVNIKVTKVERVTGFQWHQTPEGPFGDLFKRFFKEMPRFPENFQAQGMGSGVIISHDGYILTNNHVVEGAKEVTVTSADKQEYQARVVGRDAKTDLAVLKIDAKESLPEASLGNSDALKVGDWVLAIGNPFGLTQTVTSGIVSAKGRVIGAGPYDDFIQTDASINPGNSGGPLFNMNGDVVGINTAIVPQGQGIGFAIPINEAKPLIPQLISKGEVIRGYLGVSIQSITPELAKALKLGNRKGALVAEVQSDTPAEKGGIKRGDVIVNFNNESVENARDLSAMVAKTPVGQEVPVTVLREGVEHKLPVKVGRLGSEKAMAEEAGQHEQGKWGLLLEDVNPRMADQLGLSSDHGVVVVGVKPGSPADHAGIHESDVILEVNRQPVKSVKDVKDAITKANDKDALLLLVKREQGSFFVALEG